MAFATAVVFATLTLTPPGPPTVYAEAIVINLDDDGEGDCPATCTLREAILYANSLAGPHSITFANIDFGGSIELDFPLPQIENDTEIIGPGSGLLTILGVGFEAGDGSVFTVDNGATVSISGLTISGGDAFVGGGIAVNPNATLNLNDVAVMDNRASVGEGGGYGGGIYVASGATANLQNVQVSGNSADGYGGGIYSSWGAELTVQGGSDISSNNAEAGGGVFIEGKDGVSDAQVLFSASYVTGNTAVWAGGGIYVGDGMTPTLSEMTVSGNTAGSEFYVGFGGGLYVGWSATLNLTNGSSVTGNSGGIDGEAAGFGGGIYLESGTLNAWQSSITNNSAHFVIETGGSGGGVYMSSAQATFTDVAISGNQSDSRGGGIYSEAGFSEGTVYLTRSTVSGNSAVWGGGLYLSDEEAYLTNSTVSGNSATSDGAGLYLSDSAYAELVHVTVAENDAGSGVGGIYAYFYSDGARLINTILASNLGANCNLDGFFSVAGDNLSDDDSCTGITETQAPLGLGPLQVNAPGFTATHALLDGSPAIDGVTSESGINACDSLVDQDTPATDQRGVARPIGPLCDIGAFEAAEAPSAPDMVAEKSNDFEYWEYDQIVLGETFRWQIDVFNVGNSAAVFGPNELILEDHLPSGATYAELTYEFNLGNNGGAFTCSINQQTYVLTCTAGGEGVTFGSGETPGGFFVSFDVTPTQTGYFTNPRDGGLCRVFEPSGSNGDASNNACIDPETEQAYNQVLVIAPDLTVTKYTNLEGEEPVDRPIGDHWFWFFEIINQGQADAPFSEGDVIFRDTLPSGVTYGNVQVIDDVNVSWYGVYSGESYGVGNIACAIDLNNVLTCVAQGSVRLIGNVEQQESFFTVHISAYGTSPGLKRNPPNTQGAICRVDPDDVVLEGELVLLFASAETNNDCNISIVNVIAPDLIATKTNDAEGSAQLGESFTWTIRVENQGDADAEFWPESTILIDHLPAGADYGDPSLGNITGVSGSEFIDCFIEDLEGDFVLRCDVDIEEQQEFDPIAIAPGGYFDVSFLVTPTEVTTLTNPADGGICRVDPVLGESSFGSVVEGELEGPEETNNDCNFADPENNPDAVIISPPAVPDLIATKTNDTGSTALIGEPFNWTITVANIGEETATFFSGDLILEDDLPTGATYGVPSVTNAFNVNGEDNIDCFISLGTLFCEVIDGETAVQLGPDDGETSGGSFDVTFSVTPNSLAALVEGQLLNPRAGGTCMVDPETPQIGVAAVDESDETNNECSDSVTVIAPDLTVSKTNTVNGAVQLPAGWDWIFTIANSGAGDAIFEAGEIIFTDVMPATNVTYSDLEVTNLTGIAGTGAIVCNQPSNNVISCAATGGPVIIEGLAGEGGAGAFGITVTAAPTAAGVYMNPTGGNCMVDTPGNVPETNEDNNTCTDAVTVAAAPEPDPTATNTPVPTATNTPPVSTNTPVVSAPVDDATATPAGSPSATPALTATPGTTPIQTATTTATVPVTVTTQPAVPTATSLVALAATSTPAPGETPPASPTGQPLVSVTPDPRATATPTPATRAPTASPTPTEERDDEVAGWQRTSWVQSVRGPSDTSFDFDVLLTNFILAGAFLLLIFLTSEVFNQTIRDNQNDVEAWIEKTFAPLVGLWAASQSVMRAAVNNSQSLLNWFWIGIVLVVSVFIEGFLEPEFPFGGDSWILFFSLLVSVGFMTYLTEGAEAFMARKVWHENAAVRVFPLAILIAALCVSLSRLGGITPGVLYGFVGTAVFLRPHNMTADQTGKMIFFPQLLLISMSIGAWLMVDQFRGENPSNLDVFLEGVMIGVFVGGLEGVFINILPISYMDGDKIMRWSKLAWFAFAGVASYFFWLVLLNDQREYFDAIQETTPMIAFIVVGVCLVLSILAWAWFRFRPGGHG